MKIFSLALNLHDQNTYDGVFHNQRERHTRFKHNLPYHFNLLNTDDYSLNDEFINEYFKKPNDAVPATAVE